MILFINGKSVLLTAFNFDFNISSLSKTTFTKLVRSIKNTIITNTDVT
jgi:acetyl-CoA carboxylase beta subunit